MVSMFFRKSTENVKNCMQNKRNAYSFLFID